VVDSGGWCCVVDGVGWLWWMVLMACVVDGVGWVVWWMVLDGLCGWCWMVAVDGVRWLAWWMVLDGLCGGWSLTAGFLVDTTIRCLAMKSTTRKIQ
jgi:hypothetical protein